MQSAGLQFALLNNLPRTGDSLIDALITAIGVALIAWITHAWATSIWPFFQRLFSPRGNDWPTRVVRYEYRLHNENIMSTVSGSSCNVKAVTQWLKASNCIMKNCLVDFCAVMGTSMRPNNSTAWIVVAKGIEMRYTESSSTLDEKIATRVEMFEFRGPELAALDQLIQEIGKEYERHREAMFADPVKYQYVPQVGKSLKDGLFCEIVTRRHMLTNEKTFNTLFFPDKKRILATLDDFNNKSGRYALPGVPHKLNIFLHGPPGTGKSSFIKALAAATGRHLIMIDLSALKRSKSLFHALLTERSEIKYDGGYGIRYRYKDVIYVIEEIDAANITHSRQPALQEAEPVESTTDDDKKPVKRQAPQDPMDIADILTVLQGVIDTPDRIVVVTTNHPEKLDPAIKRPGRVDEDLELEYMKADCAEEMLLHSYPESTKEQVERLRAAVTAADKLTPAKLQQLFITHFPDVDAIISHI